MFDTAIRVDPAHAGERLMPMSRINYGKVYTIEHFMRVRAFGVVMQQEELLEQFRTIFFRSQRLSD